MATGGPQLQVVHSEAEGGGPTGFGGASPELAIGRASSHRVRIVDATLGCLARHGTSKTTIDDIAREAGVSRATVYRVFPGGKDEVLAAVVDTEMARLFSGLGVCMGEADDLSDVLVAGIVAAFTRITGHPALNYVVAHEPEVVLGHLAFDESNRLLATATRFISPFLIRWMDREEAARVAEWAARIVLSYCINPSADMDLTDPRRARHLIETFVLPGIAALRSPDRSQPIDLTVIAADRRAATVAIADHSSTDHHHIRTAGTNPAKGDIT
jgi:AcrR family transcriptional regulator